MFKKKKKKILVTQNQHDIRNLIGRNGIQTYNHLICKQALNCLAMLASCLSSVVRTCV